MNTIAKKCVNACGKIGFAGWTFIAAYVIGKVIQIAIGF